MLARPSLTNIVRRRLPRAVAHGKHLAVTTEDLLQRALATAGLRQRDSTIAADAQKYWRRPSGPRWAADSHWRDSPAFDGSDLWHKIGEEHLALFEAGARMAGFTRTWDRVVEWGCGGGANAVRFAPRAGEFVGVDISTESLDECGKQIADVCDTPFRPTAVEVANPESALDRIDGECDVFLSFYVFELIPTPEYGERLLRIARDLLAPGGLALIQIKYNTGSWFTRPRRRSYRRGLADMTTYPIDGFWELSARCGLTPKAVHLVPRNELDARYAYFFLSKESATL
ncbi:class I SAM-dependent methyltransferase [Amycolatopsis roodepoortensis]|uniref:class I SAM-dependent methyltransferase n=1 Tax=Amycolatopsis roodepoortensis TaxID=700274 RepID=UPI00214B65DA|nr:class I SAM-dependent methyltransferase [Amycolatopsis roodepoortensis]UUV28674.1 class I SAM-dependent methyltransferase [Amycolatopsis roodepoortensis]